MAAYSVDQLYAKLERADAAGDAEAAKVIADEIRKSQVAPAKADFRGVQSQANSVSAAPPPSMVDGLKREAGLGARSVLQGIGSTIGMVTDPFAYAVGLPSSREGFTAVADRLGLPTPQNSSERFGGGLTEAVAGGGGLIGIGRNLATRAPGVVKRVGETLASMPGTQLAGLVGGSGASGVTRENGGGTGSQVIAGLVGGLSPAALKTMGSMGLRGLLRGGEAGRQQMDQGVRDFRAVGAQASVGQATGNRRTQGLESLLAGGPTSGGVMSRFAERQADDIGTGLQERANTLAPNAAADRAGKAIERGVETFAGNIKATRKALYWQVDRLIPDTTQLPLTRTRMALADLTRATPGAEATTGAMINPKIAQLSETISTDLANGNLQGIPYSAVKDIRTRIGEALSDYSLTTDKPTAEYKRLYAALSQDLEDAARRQGPAASEAAKRANTYYKVSQERIEQIERVVDKVGGPEKVYAAAMSGTRDGGTTLRAVMQSLPPQGQRMVTAAVIKRMGMAVDNAQNAAGDVFSSSTFMTNWNKVSPEAKRALFDRHGPQFVANMDRIARVADTIKAGSRVFANPSGTANKAAAYTYAGSLGAALVTANTGAMFGLALGGAAANGMARAMTSPRFVAWLAKATEMPVSALPQQIVVLKAMGRTDPDVAEFAEALEQEAVNRQANASEQR